MTAPMTETATSAPETASPSRPHSAQSVPSRPALLPLARRLARFGKSKLKGVLALGAGASMLGLAACDQGMMPSGSGVSRGQPVTVALLVPGGTGNANEELIARSLRQAAELAVSDLQGVQVNLRSYDTGGSPANAAAAATRAVAEGAQIILGPVYAENANAVGHAVAGKGVNVLAFSNNTDIAGGNVFVLGNTFQNTADRLVAYAKAQGRGRIMIVNDNNTAGEVGRRAIESAIQRYSATLADTASYEFSQQGVTAAAPVIVQKAQNAGATSMFLTADAAGALPLLANLLPQNGLDTGTVQLVGLTRWDIPTQTLALPGLQGGVFALPDPGPYRQFQARYQAAYGEPPHPIAGLAYDGIAAIGALARSGSGNVLSARSLTQDAGFVGVNGIFRLRPDGTNQRGLAIAKIVNNQVQVIESAPRSFSGAGF